MAGLKVSVAEAGSAQAPFRLVRLDGEADVTCAELKRTLDDEVAAGPALLVLDLSRLTFLDSWALHVILVAGQRLRRAGGALALAAPSGVVSRILDISGADTLVPVAGSVDEAAGRAAAARPGRGH
jgi:stage II sporulation protein AA (anti-sigma F factor antagonist)